MFAWLKRWRRRSQQPEARWTVAVRDGIVTITDEAGTLATVALDRLSAIVIETNDRGPFEPDVWWLLFGPDGQLAGRYPQGAIGEQQALESLFALPGFDFAAMTKAMGSTDNAAFVVWRRPQPAGPA